MIVPSVAAALQSVFPGAEFRHSRRSPHGEAGDPCIDVLSTVLTGDGEDIRIVCTAGAEHVPEGAHQHFFFGAYHVASNVMDELLAGLHHYHLTTAPLDVAHRVPLPHDCALVERGYSHLIMAEPWLFYPLGVEFECGPDGLLAGARTLAVMPARPDEVAAHQQGGHAALVEARLARGETPFTVLE